MNTESLIKEKRGIPKEIVSNILCSIFSTTSFLLTGFNPCAIKKIWRKDRCLEDIIQTSLIVMIPDC
jgi:hypothetical protein